MRNRISLLLGLFLLTALVFGGGGFAVSGEKKSAAPGDRVVLKFWKAGTATIWRDYWQKTIAEYEAANPHVKIEYVEAPQGQEFETKLNVGFLSGTGPDIVSHAIFSIAQRADKGQYFPLDQYLAKWKDKSDIMDNVYELGSYKGKVYGLAFYPIPSVIAYRKDYFKEAGLDPTKPPTTWEQLDDHAVKLTKRDGNFTIRAGLNIPIDETKWTIPFSIQNGAENITADGQPNFDNPQMVETLAYFTRLVLQKKVAIETTKEKERNQNLFSRGNAAISLVAPSDIAEMIKIDSTLKDKIGFMDIARKKRSIFSGADLLFVSGESKNKEEAWNFIQFALSTETMTKRYQVTNCPVVRKSLRSKYLEDQPIINAAIYDGIGIGVGAPKVPWSNLYLNKYLPQAMQEAFYGKKTPEQALKDNVQLLKKELQP